MYNRAYYSNVTALHLKNNDLHHSSEKVTHKKSKSLGKVTFLLGDSKTKKHSDKNWKKLVFGQRLSRGDSLRIGRESKVEITTNNGRTITLSGFKKLRIDSFILTMNQRTNQGSSENIGRDDSKITRLAGKEDKKKETSPVSAVRSNKPKNENNNEPKLKIRIGD